MPRSKSHFAVGRMHQARSSSVGQISIYLDYSLLVSLLTLQYDLKYCVRPAALGVHSCLPDYPVFFPSFHQLQGVIVVRHSILGQAFHKQPIQLTLVYVEGLGACVALSVDFMWWGGRSVMCFLFLAIRHAQVTTAQSSAASSKLLQAGGAPHSAHSQRALRECAWVCSKKVGELTTCRRS